MLQKEIAGKHHRWFIWAVVLLLVSGISLYSYIKVTEINDDVTITESLGN